MSLLSFPRFSFIPFSYDISLFSSYISVTLGVGGRPLEVALGGEVARLLEEVRSLRRGGGWGEVEPFCLVKYFMDRRIINHN